MRSSDLTVRSSVRNLTDPRVVMAILKRKQRDAKLKHSKETQKKLAGALFDCCLLFGHVCGMLYAVLCWYPSLNSTVLCFFCVSLLVVQIRW